MKNAYLVITSIAGSDNKVLNKIADESDLHKIKFILIGDKKSPSKIEIKGCDYYSSEKQTSLNYSLIEKLPFNHYARKNIGYLLAMSKGAEIIIETDDDNIPYDSFWQSRNRQIESSSVEKIGWINIYKYFTDINIWPRGLPLNKITNSVPPYEKLPNRIIDSPIQQGLANDEPDVDAVYRLLFSKPTKFNSARKIALNNGVWCPFNSQNTTWWKDAFPLLYLPSYCSFRMTDIWRSFVAQRIAWENNWQILFHEPTVFQERNDHNLMKDFEDEIPGYLNNENMCNELNSLNLKSGLENIPDNLIICYNKLVELDLVLPKEMDLLECWIVDFLKHN